MAYSAVEAPVSSRITRSRERRIRFFVADMVFSYSSWAVGTARWRAAGAARFGPSYGGPGRQPWLPGVDPGRDRRTEGALLTTERTAGCAMAHTTERSAGREGAEQGQGTGRVDARLIAGCLPSW
ncbi:hypothetical protein GCM10009591_02670 [Brachybacterium tyrofermentans]